MRFVQSVLVAVLVNMSSVGAAWTPFSHDGWKPSPNGDCLTAHQATSIVDQFIFLLENSNSSAFAPAARKLLTKDFMDQSDSVNFMAGFPLGSVTFPSRKSFIQIAGSQPPFASVKTLETFNTCNKIAWRWNATGFPPPGYEVVGINIFTVNKPRTNKVDSVHTEFNSGAFLADVGNPQCNSSSSS